MVKINQQAIVKNLPDDPMLAHLKYAGSVTDTAIINDIYKQYQSICQHFIWEHRDPSITRLLENWWSSYQVKIKIWKRPKLS